MLLPTTTPLCCRASFRRYLSRLYATNAVQTHPRPGDKVVVGMSGGVDSSVAARLLADQDYDLSAVFMRNWDTRDESGTDEGCEWKKDWEDVQRVCRSLDIPCTMIDLSREYWNRIFEPSLQIWEAGATPNPDVWCNREIKFGALLERLRIDSESDRPWFATGHYARKSWSADGRPKLLSAKDKLKDQAFYLSSITEEGLSRALFPLGEITKAEVRELARKFQLDTAERPESMGLCFVGEKGKFNRFLDSYISPRPGTIVNLMTQKVVGQHQGLWNYTIGEKAKIPGMLNKMYVARKNPVTNMIYVVPGNHEALLGNTVHCKDWSWIWKDAPPAALSSPEGFRALVKIRHRMESQPCRVYISSDGNLKIISDEPLRGIAGGQVAALWNEDWCLGCGTILPESEPHVELLQSPSQPQSHSHSRPLPHIQFEKPELRQVQWQQRQRQGAQQRQQQEQSSHVNTARGRVNSSRHGRANAAAREQSSSITGLNTEKGRVWKPSSDLNKLNQQSKDWQWWD